MPKKLEKKLKNEAEKMHMSKERTGAYVYGNPVMQKYMRESTRGKKK